MDESKHNVAAADIQRRIVHLLERTDQEPPTEVIRQIKDILTVAPADKTVRVSLSGSLQPQEAILQSLSQPLLVVDRDMKVRFVNRAYCEKFHSAAEAVIDESIFEIEHGRWDNPDVRSHIQRAFREFADSAGVELEEIFPHIGRRALCLQIRPVHLDAEEPSLVLVEIEDITPRKDADLARRHLTAIVESSDEAIFRKDLGGIITVWNRGAQKMYGYSPEEAIGRHVRLVVPEDRYGELNELMTRLRAGQPTVQFQTVRRRKDGELIDVSLTISPIFDESGAVVAGAAVGRDISSQMKLQRDLAELAVIVDSSSDAIIGLTPEGKITSWNRGAEVMYGYGASEAIGGSIGLIVPDENQEESEKLMTLIRQGTRIEQYETEYRRRDGTTVSVSVTFTPIFGSNGHVRAVSVMARDFTQRRRYQQQLEQINLQLERINHDLRHRTEQLERANSDLESFSYGVSHDLRAPLRTIDGFSHALSEDYADQLDATGRDYLQRIQDATAHMKMLIEALLRLSRVSRVDLRWMSTDLTEVATVVVERLRRQYPHRRVDFIAPQAARATCDRQLMEVVLENLLSNAWKFTGERDIARIEFGVTKQGNKDVYFVRDNGAGFDPRYAAERLFRHFQRLHHEDRFPGLGMGLPIVKRVIERHGGAIWAESSLEEGAAFYFTIGQNGDIPEPA